MKQTEKFENCVQDECNLFHKILHQHHDSKLLQGLETYYNKYAILSRDYRKQISDMIYKYFINNNLSFKTAVLNEIVQQIEDKFPNEKKV